MLLYCTCRRFCTLLDKITCIVFLLCQLFPCSWARVINCLCLSIWFICGTLTRGNLPLGVVARAGSSTSCSWIFMQQHHSRLTGVHSIPKHCSFACLVFCRLQGFFYFSPCQLCFYQVIFSFISSQVLISTSFFRPTRFSWSFVPKPTSISLLTRCYIIPDSWTSQMSTFVEFNVVLVHLGPHKKKGNQDEVTCYASGIGFSQQAHAGP